MIQISQRRCVQPIMKTGHTLHTLRQPRKWHAGVIVMGTHGRRGFQRLVLGSIAERVLRGAICPALMIPARANETPADPASTASAEKELT